jgi:putative toxin-antitoxin system antitoxin component (TIGR02293 family)
MKKSAAMTQQTSRNKARASLWCFLDDSPAGGVGSPAGRAAAGQPQPQPHPIAGLSKAKLTPFTKIDDISAHRIVKRGISSRAISPLGDFLGLGKGTVAEYLDLDRGTANRRAAKDQPLPLHAAEGVLRLLELDRMAADTFEQEAEASQWLRKPHPMLEGETPLEAAKTSYGAQRVKDILLAIKYGGAV